MGLRAQRAFTLLELILYLALVSTIIGAVVIFAINIITLNSKSTGQEELAANARIISSRIINEIRQSSGINSVSSSSINLVTSAPNNPTIIDLSGGRVRLQLGVQTPVFISPQGVTINSLTFTNLTSSNNNTKHVAFSFTISLNNTSARSEYQQSATFRSSAELRSN